MKSRILASSRGEFSSRSFRCSLGRICFVIAVPSLAGCALLQQAARYFHLIPPGDVTFRSLVFGVFVALAACLLAIAAHTLLSHMGHTVLVEAGRLVIRDSSAMVCADWSAVSMSAPQSRLGVRQAVVCVNGRTRVVDDLFFPNFDEICAAIAERVRTSDRAMRHTVSADLVRVG